MQGGDEEARERRRAGEVLPGDTVDGSGRFSTPGRGTPKSRLSACEEVNYLCL